MFFVDKPYISDFFKKTVLENGIPIVNTAIAQQLNLYQGSKLISEAEAIEMIKLNHAIPIYATSENSIGWISKNMHFSALPQKIELFKNKTKFRELIKSMYPDFYFREVMLKDLKKINFYELPLPFIIKPTVGFFSMGVYKVSNYEEWQRTINNIESEMVGVKDLYPDEVLNSTSFIIEQCIDGEEFACDAYYNSNGKPVVLSIFKHTFASSEDVSDRIYMSSKKIIQNHVDQFTEFLEKIGNLAEIKNFPMHIELRRDKNGKLIPIEINPMRFGGWCTTADATFMAYEFNPYLYYFHQKEPNWNHILRDKSDTIYSIVILDNSTGIDANKINSFNYSKLITKFENPLELRKINFREYPVFGFLFTATSENNMEELENILHSDLTEFISVDSK